LAKASDDAFRRVGRGESERNNSEEEVHRLIIRLDRVGVALPPLPAPDPAAECRPHLDNGEHLKLYRFSEADFREVGAAFNGQHPETGEELLVADVPHPEGAPAHDLPPQPADFAPDDAPEEIREIAQKLRKQAGLPDRVTGVVSEESTRSVQG
jgi:hypothetical protein